MYGGKQTLHLLDTVMSTLESYLFCHLLSCVDLKYDICCTVMNHVLSKPMPMETIHVLFGILVDQESEHR